MIQQATKPTINFYFTIPGSFLKDRTALKAFIALLFKKEKKKLTSLNYIFCSDEYLLDINKQYLNHDFYTDIITFELSDNESTEGEIYISIDRVKENALQFGTAFQEELHRVIFHGALHLCGYKDKTKADIAEMRRKERKYLADYIL
jgi:rRNA maturation RNase YbeY